MDNMQQVDQQVNNQPDPNMQQNQAKPDPRLIPTHPALLQYAMAVHFFHYAGQVAANDILSPSPNANGLFPSTLSNYDLVMDKAESDPKSEQEAEADLDSIFNSSDPDIADAFNKAAQEIDEDE